MAAQLFQRKTRPALTYLADKLFLTFSLLRTIQAVAGRVWTFFTPRDLQQKRRHNGKALLFVDRSNADLVDFTDGSQAKAGSSSSPQDRDTETTSSSLPWRLEPGSLHLVFFSSFALVSLHRDHLRKAPVESRYHLMALLGGRITHRHDQLPLRSVGFFSCFLVSVASFSGFFLLLLCFLLLSSEVPA